MIWPVTIQARAEKLARNRSLVDVVVVHVVQVAVVEVVGVVAVLDLFVSAARLVRMVMSIVGVVLCHAFVSLRCSASRLPEP